MSGSKGRLAWLVTGVLATIIAIVTAGTSVWYETAFRQHIHTRHQTVSYPGDPGLVTVVLSDGDMTITSGVPGRVTVSSDLSWAGGQQVTGEQWHGRGLTITQQCPSGFDDVCTASYRIAVPPGVPLNLQTASGNIVADGVRSPGIQATSGAGDITLGFTSAPNNVWASSDSGNVTVTVPRGGSYAVHPQDVSGNSSIEVTADPSAPRTITVISDAGNIAVGYR
jgi:hypothetical protein